MWAFLLQVFDNLRGLQWALDQTSITATIRAVLKQPKLVFVEVELIESRCASLAKALGTSRLEVLRMAMDNADILATRVPQALRTFFPGLINPRASPAAAAEMLQSNWKPPGV